MAAPQPMRVQATWQGDRCDRRLALTRECSRQHRAPAAIWHERAHYCGGIMTVMDALDLTDAIQRWLVETDLPIQPKHAHIVTFEDALGQEGWRVVLTLHRPEGATWDQQDLFTTRQIVAAELDNIAEAQGQVLPGTTLVSVTSDEGAAEDIGVDIPSDADEVHISSEDVDREDARADEEQE